MSAAGLFATLERAESALGDPFASLRAVAVPATYVFAVAVIFLELFILVVARKPWTHRSGVASLASGAASFALLFVADRLWMTALYALAYRHRLFDLGGGPAVWLGTFVAYDLMFYVVHRLGHEVRLFWCFHHAHHTSTEMRLSSAVRGSAFDFVYLPWFWAWIPLLGVHPSLLLVVESFARMWGILTHVSPHLVGRLGPLEGVLVTPSVHRVHHGKNAAYLDRNYGETLLLWDRVFGTYVPETEEPRYGVTKPIDGDSLAAIHLGPWRDLAHDLARARSWRARLGHLFAPPGWDDDAPVARPDAQPLDERDAQPLDERDA